MIATKFKRNKLDIGKFVKSDKVFTAFGLLSVLVVTGSFADTVPESVIFKFSSSVNLSCTLLKLKVLTGACFPKFMKHETIGKSSNIRNKFRKMVHFIVVI